MIAALRTWWWRRIRRRDVRRREARWRRFYLASVNQPRRSSG